MMRASLLFRVDVELMWLSSMPDLEAEISFLETDALFLNSLAVFSFLAMIITQTDKVTCATEENPMSKSDHMTFLIIGRLGCNHKVGRDALNTGSKVTGMPMWANTGMRVTMLILKKPITTARVLLMEMIPRKCRGRATQRHRATAR